MVNPIIKVWCHTKEPPVKKIAPVIMAAMFMGLNGYAKEWPIICENLRDESGTATGAALGDPGTLEVNGWQTLLQVGQNTLPFSAETFGLVTQSPHQRSWHLGQIQSETTVGWLWQPLATGKAGGKGTGTGIGGGPATTGA